MINGYPSIDAIETYLAAQGVEVMALGEVNWLDSFRKCIYSIVKAVEPMLSLTVYAPTVSTINVRGGHYNYGGTAKEYTPGAAIDPADNDTTYVWLTATNTIASGIDGSGWPVTEHVPLAEVDVDASGNVTDIRNLLGKSIIVTPVPAV